MLHVLTPKINHRFAGIMMPTAKRDIFSAVLATTGERNLMMKLDLRRLTAPPPALADECASPPVALEHSALDVSRDVSRALFRARGSAVFRPRMLSRFGALSISDARPLSRARSLTRV